MKKPQDCRSMAEVRAEIDRIDAALMGLFAERAAYIDRAAAVKTGLGLPARIDDRVEQVIDNVRRHAVETGLPPEPFEAIWRGLVDWSIEREETVLGKDQKNDR